MKRFRVAGVATISVHTDVDAETPEEAIQIAKWRPMQRLCFQCSGAEGADDEWRTSGELDGEPDELEAEEI
jgi:hypothetical protein